MKKRILIISGSILLIFLAAAVYFAFRHKPDAAVVLLQSGNVKDYEAVFGIELRQYIKEEDTEIEAEDLTDTDWNRYDDGVNRIDRCYPALSMLPAVRLEDAAFGTVYRIPAFYLWAGSSVMLCKEEGGAWEVTDQAVKITYSFDVAQKPGETAAEVEIGDRVDGIHRNTTYLKNKETHYEGTIWRFKGESFYPRIDNAGEEDLIILNGKLTITRDDTMKKE